MYYFDSIVCLWIFDENWFNIGFFCDLIVIMLFGVVLVFVFY